jgi:hypothetical protein
MSRLHLAHAKDRQGRWFVNMRLVLLGLVRDYENLWHISTFVLPTHGHEQLFGIFSHGSVV